MKSYQDKQRAMRQQGWTDFHAGKPIQDFPGHGERERAEWEIGWRSAKDGEAKPYTDLENTVIEYVRIKRECPHNEEIEAKNKKGLLLYDFNVMINGEHRATLSKKSGSRGYYIQDVVSKGIKEEVWHPWYGTEIESQHLFTPTIERLLVKDLIPTRKQITERENARQREEDLKLAKHRNRVEIAIGVVPHGLEINVRNYVRSTTDGNGVEVTNVCGDFAGNYEVGKICDAIGPAIIEALKGLERKL